MPRKMRIGITRKIFPRPVFEMILRRHLPQNDVNLVMLAYQQAKHGHKNQKRDDRSRHFDHVKRTALIIILELKIYIPWLIISALLHDIREKCFILKPWGIKHIFGKRVARAVEILTKGKGKNYKQGLTNASWGVKLIKLCDRLDNVRTLAKCKKEKKIRQLKETKKFYVPLAEQLIKEIPIKYRDRAIYLLEEIKWACQMVERTLK